MAKIVMIGAGSTVFAKNLMGDIWSREATRDAHIVLMDIDAERLKTSEIVGQAIKAKLGVPGQLTTTLDRREALKGADYVICMVQVAGYKPGTVIDFEIPKKYGLKQTIADTLGIGGIFRALRTIPVLNGIALDMEELCPDATLLNYTNPMAMLCWAVSCVSGVETVGLCHSVQGTAGQLAKNIDIPVDEISYLCAGINHMAFYLRFERNGEDLYPLIHKVVEEGRIPDDNRVRYEMMRWLGYFVTESSEHFSEYCPHFIRDDAPELIERFNIPIDEYIRRCEVQIEGWQGMRADLEAGKDIEVRESMEYGSTIINAMETNEPAVIYGNVPNDGLIDNLTAGCCVEVPCLVDKMGIQPTPIGDLPPQLAAICMTNVNVQSLTVEAALTGRRDHVYQAAMLDPHTAQSCTLDQIKDMCDDLFEAHGDWIPPMN